MTKKEMKNIYNIIAAAEDSISLLACDNFPYSDFCDKDFKDMFYQLNDMLLLLHKKMESADTKSESV